MKHSAQDLLVLCLLKELSRNGYLIWEEIRYRDMCNWISISRTQIYYSLKKLLNKSLVEVDSEASIKSEPGRGPGNYYYNLLPQGDGFLLKCLTADHWALCESPQEFMTWIGLATLANLPWETRREVESKRVESLKVRLKRHTDYLTAIKYEAGKPITRRYLEFQIRQLDGEISFLLS